MAFATSSTHIFRRLFKTHCFQQAFGSPKRLTQVPQIRPLADIVHSKYAFIHLRTLTYLMTRVFLAPFLCKNQEARAVISATQCVLQTLDCKVICTAGSQVTIGTASSSAWQVEVVVVVVVVKYLVP